MMKRKHPDKRTVPARHRDVPGLALLIALSALSISPGQTAPVTATVRDSATRVGRPQSSPKKDNQPLTALQQGERMSEHGLYKDAVDQFTRAADADQNNPVPYNRRARAEWQVERLKDALEDANWAIKLNPDYAEAYCTRAAIYNSMGQYQYAVSDASMAVDLNPALREGYLIGSTAYNNLGQHEEANQVIAKMNRAPRLETAFIEWQPPVNYNEYFDYVDARVREHFRPPAGSQYVAVPIFKIHRDGKITNLRLDNTTGNSTADNAALQAVRESVPFREPPAGAPPDLDVSVVLDRSVQQAQFQQPPQLSPAPANQRAAEPAPVPSAAAANNGGNNNGQRSGFNWRGTAVNQGINMMMRFIPR